MEQKTEPTRRAVLTGLTAVPLAAVAGSAAASETAAAANRGPRARRHRTIHIAGDSTAAPKDVASAPEAGWGMALPYYLAGHVAVANHARNGRSSKSFVDEGRLDRIAEAIAPGDILLTQFSHNDEKITDPARGTDPWTTYQEYLTRYVDVARTAGAAPVFATSAERRRFDDDGNARETHGEYPHAMRALAAELGVPLIDVQPQTLALWQELGPEETKNYFLWTDTEQDNTHFQPRGAAAVALMVAEGLLSTCLLRRGDVRRLDETPSDDWFTWLPERPD
ncbi:rhamnogalacturonan acetylesterase [Myceligenerans pegani]|uniref:Rhamnogalacturonan acetylesterase n=1 Tax=Myceligenerans pegani TaxID=2776917 RepID=A0ABR9N4V1_9MICO|nr:rhamnogalacturonan acetylesterase [Myceligenerans sp. TRM 65318]MBE1878683.1 rhamnogalacturonan acetylesterase [Myceligenerans sp. TRM 65318]MBE3020954.1 rhamnogalacturonan acetylesterase [Myceligenerans sp. TRM 65318]